MSFSIVSDCIILYGSTTIPIHITIEHMKQNNILWVKLALSALVTVMETGFVERPKAITITGFPARSFFLEMASLYIFIILENSAK